MQTQHCRRGAVAVFVALLLIPLFAFVALCIDIGWIAVTQSELQNAADSAAAAGARQLIDSYAATLAPTQLDRSSHIAAARGNAAQYSFRFGGYNSAGGVNSLTILPADVQFGFTDAQGQFDTSFTGYPNTVQVTVRRDQSANGKLPLFFAPVIGHRDHPLTATASATIYAGLISSFDPSLTRHRGTPGGSSNCKGGSDCAGGRSSNGGDSESGWAGSEGEGSAAGRYPCGLLPVAFDVNHWNAFFATGMSPDGLVHFDEAGNPQIQIYPSPQTSPGNVGLLCIGPPTNNNPSFREWILSGPLDTDLEYLISARHLPVSLQSPKQWKGTPGLKSELQREFEMILGEPRLLPLFQPVSRAPYQAAHGNGSNATYEIVGFAGVTISQATGRGSNMVISVTPTDVVDPTAVYDSATLYPVGAEPPGQFKSLTHPAPKFTR